MALSTVLVVAIATIVGMAFRQRLKRRLEYKRSQPESERNTDMNATRQPNRGSEFPLNDYEQINASIDVHTYDWAVISNEALYQNVLAGSIDPLSLSVGYITERSVNNSICLVKQNLTLSTFCVE